MILNSPYITGSLTVTGNANFQGALIVTGSLSGTASLALNSNLLQGTGSVGFTTTASFNAVSSSQQQISSSQQQISASYISLSGSYNTFSGSASTRITANSSSIQQVSSSQQQISASLLNVVANYATTGSNSFRADQSITGSLVVSSTITAQTLVVQTVTSSIVYSSGSNIFGNQLANTQTFTGSVNITGSLALAGNITSNGTAVVLGSGTTNYLPKFTAASTIGNSVISESGTIITVAGSSRFTGFDSGYYNENVLAIGNGTNNPKIGLASTSGYRWNTRIKDVGGNGEYIIRYEEGSLDALIINRSGNLGLGVTPSAWGTGRTAIQLKGSSTAVYFAGEGNTILSNNYYFDSGDKYIANGFSTQYLQGASGQHAWYIAPNNTSGAGASLSYAQAMTLDASGNLMLGGTSSTGYWPANLTQSAAKQIIQYNDSTTNLNNANAGLVILNSNTTAATSSKLVFGAYNTDPVAVGLAYISAVNSTRSSGYLTGDLVFGTSGGGGTGAVEGMRITSGGNVGIGSTAPQSILETYAASPIVTITDSNAFSNLVARTSGIEFKALNPSSNNTTQSAGIYGVITPETGYTPNQGYLTFYTRLQGGSYTEKMRITSGGNVGIGTVSPDMNNWGANHTILGLSTAVAGKSSQLNLRGNSNATANVMIGTLSYLDSSGTGAGSSLAGIDVYSATATSGRPGSYMVFSTNDGSSTAVPATERMRITSGGYLGIGTISPLNKVDISAAGSNNTIGSLAVRGSGAGTFVVNRIVSRETANQTLTIATVSSPGGNDRVFFKIQVINVSAVANYGNAHVGYALWDATTKSVTTMTLDTGNSNISNTNVGSLSWSGNNLQYTTNGAGNYENNHIIIYAVARDSATVI